MYSEKKCCTAVNISLTFHTIACSLTAQCTIYHHSQFLSVPVVSLCDNGVLPVPYLPTRFSPLSLSLSISSYIRLPSALSLAPACVTSLNLYLGLNLDLNHYSHRRVGKQDKFCVCTSTCCYTCIRTCSAPVHISLYVPPVYTCTSRRVPCISLIPVSHLHLTCTSHHLYLTCTPVPFSGIPLPG